MDRYSLRSILAIWFIALLIIACNFLVERSTFDRYMAFFIIIDIIAVGIALFMTFYPRIKRK